jgi:alkylation response protein AidB-like acyl-CoA dehydrogenase
MKYAHPEVREILLPEMAKGRELVAFAMTEPQAGSNPRDIQSVAVPDGDSEWKLYGEKIWSGTAA